MPHLFFALSQCGQGIGEAVGPVHCNLSHILKDVARQSLAEVCWGNATLCPSHPIVAYRQFLAPYRGVVLGAGLPPMPGPEGPGGAVMVELTIDGSEVSTKPGRLRGSSSAVQPNENATHRAERNSKTRIARAFPGRGLEIDRTLAAIGDAVDGDPGAPIDVFVEVGHRTVAAKAKDGAP